MEHKYAPGRTDDNVATNGGIASAGEQPSAGVPGRRTRSGEQPPPQARRVAHDAAASHGEPSGADLQVGQGPIEAGSASHAAVTAASQSTGIALPAAQRAKFERSLGVDLGSVRLHDGAPAAAASSALGARAFTRGQDIFFNRGQFAPDQPAGELLLAHEVAHTVQQGHGTRDVATKLDVAEPGDGHEREADAAATAMVSGQPYRVQPGTTRTAAALLQRKVGMGLELAVPVGKGAGWEGLATRIPAKTRIGKFGTVKAVVDHSSRIGDTKFSILELVTPAVELTSPAARGLAQIDTIVSDLHQAVAAFSNPAQQQTIRGDLAVGFPAPRDGADETAQVEKQAISRSKEGATTKATLRNAVTTNAFVQLTVGAAPGAMREVLKAAAARTRGNDGAQYMTKIPDIVDEVMKSALKRIPDNVRKEAIESLLLLVVSYLVYGKAANAGGLTKNMVPVLSKTDLAQVRIKTLSQAEIEFLQDTRQKGLPGLVISKSKRKPSHTLLHGQTGVTCRDFVENVLWTGKSDQFTDQATRTQGVVSPLLKKVDHDVVPGQPAQGGAILELRRVPNFTAPDDWGRLFKEVYRESLQLHGFPADAVVNAPANEEGSTSTSGEAHDAEHNTDHATQNV